jgi:hypothetical protein
MILNALTGHIKKIISIKTKIPGKNEELLLTNLIQMPRNELTKDELKVRVLELRKKLNGEPYSEGIKFLADSYLNKVLDIIEEYRY